MNIAIIGAGAIGLLTGGYATLAHINVDLFTRTEAQAEILRKEGLLLQRENVQTNVSVGAKLFEDTDFSSYDVIILAVKQYSLQEVLTKLAQSSVSAPLVFMQNGLSHLAYAKQWEHLFPTIAIIEHGALKTAENVVVHTGIGQTLYGSFTTIPETVKQLMNKLTAVGFTTVVREDWQRVLEYKFLANASINPLTALFQVQNGKLLQNSFLTKLTKQLFLEAQQLFSHIDEKKAWDYVCSVIEKTAENRSSMLADRTAGRKTEIEAISGYVVAEGELRGKLLPYTTFVYDGIRAIEEESRRFNE